MPAILVCLMYIILLDVQNIILDVNNLFSFFYSAQFTFYNDCSRCMYASYSAMFINNAVIRSVFIQLFVVESYFP